MKYRAYPEYKDSGVEWLGEVPSHWDVKKGGYIGTLFGSESISDSSVVNDGLLPYLKVDSLDLNSFNLKKIEWYVSKEHAARCKKKNSYIVFPKRGAAIFTNKVNIVRVYSVVDPNLMGWQIAPSGNLRFIAYALSARTLTDLADTSTVPQINNKHINPTKFPFPNLREQTIIASFLDRETQKIDELITKQQRLIDLLKEKRQAVISHAVTKGINPDVKMKDSGVEWLGKIPEHWRIETRIKFISSLKGRLGWQGLKAEEYIDEGPYVVSSAHFNNHRIQWNACPHVSLERYELDSNIQLAENDILLMKDGAALGKLAYVDELPDKACLNSHLLLFRPTKRNGEISYTPKFMFYFMQTNLFQDFVKINGTGATFLGISQQSVGNYHLVLPPLEEQKDIVNFLNEKIAKLKLLEEKNIAIINLLQERRTALISAAVTGKIDVRNA